MNQRLLKNGENINSQDITLFCFPFAGGGASAYNSWVQKMKGKVTVCPIQLPGREEEKLVTLILKADNASSLTGLAIASMANILIKERNRPNNSVLSMWQYQTYIPELAKEIVDSSGVYTEEYTCSIETLSEMEEGEI